jgi:hypothetical protein
MYIPEDLAKEHWEAYAQEQKKMTRCSSIKEVAKLTAAQFDGSFIVNVITPDYFTLDDPESRTAIQSINQLGFLTTDSANYDDGGGVKALNEEQRSWQERMKSLALERRIMTPTYTKDIQLSYVLVLVPRTILEKMFMKSITDGSMWIDDGFNVCVRFDNRQTKYGLICMTSDITETVGEIPVSFTNLYKSIGSFPYYRYARGTLRSVPLKKTLGGFCDNSDILSKAAKKDMLENYGELQVIDYNIKRQKEIPMSASLYAERLLKQFS